MLVLPSQPRTRDWHHFLRLVNSIYALLFLPWSVIRCYSHICVFHMCYILILCSLPLPLELVLRSCQGCFPLVTYLQPIHNN